MRDTYENPLITRYSSDEMAYIFSDEKKYTTWRKLWVALAEAQKILGLDISDEQISELKHYANYVNFEEAKQREKVVRHEVKAHIYAYGLQCKLAKPIINLGATSSFVVDNADVLIYKEAIELIELKLANIVNMLAKFADKHKKVPTMGYTHYQPTQITTVGKRACLWIEDLLLDLEEINFIKNTLRLRGVKGTAGTQASLLSLFDGDEGKVRELEKLLAENVDMTRVFAITGQTYPRKQDSRIMNLLSSIAQSAHKFSNDIRLLQNLKEIEESPEKSRGAAVEVYMRTPVRSERMASLSRFIMSLTTNTQFTAASQWFERTLDDSANKRLSLPQAFLAVDAVLNIYMNLANGLVVYEKVIENHIKEELPFMAIDAILEKAQERGGDIRELREKIRVYSAQAARTIKTEGKENNFLEFIIGDPGFPLMEQEIMEIMDPLNFIGMADVQTEVFLKNNVEPLLKRYSGKLDMRGEVNV